MHLVALDCPTRRPHLKLADQLDPKLPGQGRQRTVYRCAAKIGALRDKLQCSWT